MNTEQATYNQAKRDILNITAKLGTVTSMEIALITHRTPEAASMALLRYHGQGLLRRLNLRGRTKVYTLTERGKERLEWLISKLLEESG